jgi:hypothetical protein
VSINIVMIILMVLAIAQMAVVLRRLEIESSEEKQTTARLQEAFTQMTSDVERAGQIVQASETLLNQTMGEVERCRGLKEEVDTELMEMESRPKQRLFVPDKQTVIYAKLWEVTIVNPTLLTAPRPVPTAEEWGSGRTWLFGAPTEREAVMRAESRFPSSQGYRIINSRRFRRP